MQSRMAVLFLAFATLSQVDARSAPAANTHAALLAKGSKISPPLKDVRSDKKFFGPNGDYAADARPVPDKSVLDKLKGPSQPYPALQSKDKFDADYVKDENSDRGAWKAQFEYDYLRRKMQKEAADASVAGDNAGKEAGDVDGAQRKADAARAAADGAQKDLDSAKREEGDAMQPEDFDDMPETTIKEKKLKLEKLNTAVTDAEANLEKEKAQFEICKKQFEDAKKNIAELKAKQVEMEQKLAADTKLWVETKTVRLNLQKAKEGSAQSKTAAAIQELRVQQAAKAEVDKVLAEKKAVSAKAQEHLAAEKAELAKAKADLEKATLTLQKLRGYAPAVPTSAPAQSMWTRWFR
jgi:hypothetical protein